MEDMSEIMLTLDKINCRVCLQFSGIVNSLQDLAMCEEQILLKDLLKQVTGIELTMYENEIPHSICEKCTNKLLSANKFIRMVERAEQILVNFVYTGNEMTDKKKYIENSQTKKQHIAPNETIFNKAALSEEEGADFKFVECSTNHTDENDDDSTDDNDIHANTLCEVTTNHAVDSYSDEHVDNEAKIKTLAVETLKKHRGEIGSRLKSYHTSGWFSCTECSRQFAKETTLNRHMDSVHTSLPTRRNTTLLQPNAARGKFLDCPYCPHQFVRKHSLRRHIARCHPEKPQIGTDEDDIIKSDKLPSGYKRCLCPHCGKSYSQASLTIHIRRHTGEAPYKCAQCDKAFPRRQDLTVHERQHTGEKPHSCIICGKSFVTSNKLTVHLRIHTGVRPYKCDQCDKAFAQSNDLKIHLRRHTGEKPYKCNVCGESFISGSMLNTHRYKTQHKPKGEKVDRYANCRLSTKHTSPESFLKRKHDSTLQNEDNNL